MLNVHDGLRIPLKAKLVKLQGVYLQKTAQSFYKTSYLILKNSELYLYNDDETWNLEHLLILTPGVFIHKLKEISIPEGSSSFFDLSKVYPIEVYVGGNISNNGLGNV